MDERDRIRRELLRRAGRVEPAVPPSMAPPSMAPPSMAPPGFPPPTTVGVPVPPRPQPAPQRAPRAWRPDPAADAAVPEPPADLVDAVAPVVLAVVPAVAAAIPDGPAAVLGRLGTPRVADRPGPGPGEFLAERLLGALELLVDRVEITAPAALADFVRLPVREGAFSFSTLTGSPMGGGSSEVAMALAPLGHLAPDLRDQVTGLVAALAGRLDPVTGTDSEPEVAAAHGRAVLALAVATALVVLRTADVPLCGDRPPVVVGVALEAATRVLPQLPMPAGYAAAMQRRRQAEYRMPRSSAGGVSVEYHRFGLVEGTFPDVGEPDNGLVQAIQGGLVVRTGVADGRVAMLVRVLAAAPEELDQDAWHEVVEVSYQAVDGAASMISPSGSGERMGELTPPWPGPIRARVHARGRDDGERGESYQIDLWATPAEPEVVHKAADGLGHRLRGEPEPAPLVRPEVPYRWVHDHTSMLCVAATITVVSGSSAEDVLRAFGADPATPAGFRDVLEEYGVDPWVAVLPIDGVVLAVEVNGYQGAQGPVLAAASAGGRAASMFWNVNAHKRLSFARDGVVLASFEPPPYEPPTDAAVLDALEGLEIEDYHDSTGKGLAAVERFTGRGIMPEDLERIEAAGVAYRILPRLPQLYAEERLPDGTRRWPGGPFPEADSLVSWDDDALRERAWWAVAEAVTRAGLAAVPAVAASLAARTLTPEAERLARASQLDGGTHRQAWLALHEATNPDAPSAAIHTIDKARWEFGPDAATFLEAVRARILSRPASPPRPR